MRTTAALLTLALSMPPGLVASAATPTAAESERYLTKGVELRRQKRHAESLDAFRKAHELDPSPRTLAQIGLAEQSLKRWVDAELHLTQALASSEYPWIAKNRQPLEQALSAVKSHVGQLAVVGPRGARVIVGEADSGTLPLANPVHVSEGPTSVRVQLDGYVPFERNLSVPGGGSLTIEATLAPLAPAEPAVGAAPAPAALSFDRDQPASGQTSRIVGWSLLGVSAAAIAAGVTFLVLDGKETCSKPSPDARCPRLYDTKLEGWVALGAGVAAGAAGGLFLYRSQRGDVALSLTPSALLATGRF